MRFAPAAAAFGLALGLVFPADAQMQGRFIVGPAISGVFPFDGDLGSNISPSVFVRQRPKKGLSPAFGLNWYTADLRRQPDRRVLGEVRVRPLMLGPGYTFLLGNVSINASLVAGYSLNKARTMDSGLLAQGASFNAKNGFVIRPSVGLMWAFGRRWAVIAGAGVVFAKPDVSLTTVTNGVTRVERGTWKANVFSCQIGVGYSIF